MFLELLHYLSFLVSGFCPLLWIAAVMFFLCWKPLGNPNPQPINLAIGVLLIIIIFLQAAFNAHQVYYFKKFVAFLFVTKFLFVIGTLIKQSDGKHFQDDAIFC